MFTKQKIYKSSDLVNPDLSNALASYGLMTEDDPYRKVLQNYLKHDRDCVDALIRGYVTVNERFGVSKHMTIEKVIFNNPATIVIWADGSKTVVKAKNEIFDPEKGLAMAISKKFFGNNGKYFNVFKKWIPELKIRELYDDVYFEKVCTNVNSNILHLYFVAPRDLLGEKYKDAEYTRICLEIEKDTFDVENASVMFSPVKNGSESPFSAYDWFHVKIPDDIIENLVDLYKLYENSGQ